MVVPGHIVPTGTVLTNILLSSEKSFKKVSELVRKHGNVAVFLPACHPEDGPLEPPCSHSKLIPGNSWERPTKPSGPGTPLSRHYHRYREHNSGRGIQKSTPARTKFYTKEAFTAIQEASPAQSSDILQSTRNCSITIQHSFAAGQFPIH